MSLTYCIDFQSTYSWTEVFSDPDSGMAYYKWGVGSRPGYDDKYSFVETPNECSQTQQDRPLELNEGHSYFITVLVQ